MHMRALSTTALLLSTSLAAASDAVLPAVETMTCDQMIAEMTVAGQKMNSQMDPEFAREAQAMADEAKGAAAGAVATGIGSAIACSLPGIGMLCGVTAQMSGMAGASEEHMARMEAQMARLEKAMEGLDMARLQAMSERFEEQKCQVPQDGGATPAP